MGQRLNIEITNGEKCLANAYYHWSGYTQSAAYWTDYILNTYFHKTLHNPAYLNTPEDQTILAIKLLESTGAGVTDFERACIKENKTLPEIVRNYSYNTASSRNEGLIGVTQDQIDATRKWEEGRVTIDIVHETVNFDCWWFGTFEQYKECYEESPDNLKELPMDPTEIRFSRFGEFKNLIDLLHDDEIYAIRSDDGMGVYCFIA